MDIDSYNKPWPRPILFKKSVGSKRLLICAGDSWTWGDSLGSINYKPGQALTDDFEWRTSHIYGALIANRANVDFINLGMPGNSNIEIIDAIFLDIIPTCYHQYEKIVVVFTLTELCREIINDPVWTSNVREFNGLDDFLCKYEHAMFDTIQHYKNQYPSIEIRVARNFTYTFLKNIPEFHLDKTWVDVIADHTGHCDYPKNLRILTVMATEPLITYIKQQQFPSEIWKADFVNMLSDGLEAVAWLNNSPCNYKKASKHPTEKGHELWADYIYQQCKNILND